MQKTLQHDNSAADWQQEFCLTVAEDLQQFASLHKTEVDVSLLRVLIAHKFPSNLGLILNSDQAKKAQELLTAEFKRFEQEGIDQSCLDLLAVDFANIYLVNAYQASPYESVWLDEDHIERQLPMFQIRGWYRKYELASADDNHMPEDHLCLQLEFIAQLLTGEEDNKLALVAQFMDEHLLRWVDEFTSRVAKFSATDYYAAVALLTAAYVHELRNKLVLITGQKIPSKKEIERRMRVIKPLGGCESGSYLPGIAPSW